MPRSFLPAMKRRRKQFRFRHCFDFLNHKSTCLRPFCQKFWCFVFLDQFLVSFDFLEGNFSFCVFIHFFDKNFLNFFSTPPWYTSTFSAKTWYHLTVSILSTESIQTFLNCSLQSEKKFNKYYLSFSFPIPPSINIFKKEGVFNFYFDILFFFSYRFSKL